MNTTMTVGSVPAGRTRPEGEAVTTAADTVPAGGSDGSRSDAVVAMGSDRYLTFTLRGETFALPILDVTEIMEFHSLTTVPMMPSFIRGVINLRGRVVPVIDMSARFGRGTTEVGRRTSIIIVNTATDTGGNRNDDQGSHHSMGILVDAVNKVMHLNADDVEPPPEFGTGIRTDFISGMAKSDGQFIIVLDVNHVLSLEELGMVDRAASVGQTALVDRTAPNDETPSNDRTTPNDQAPSNDRTTPNDQAPSNDRTTPNDQAPSTSSSPGEGSPV
jgi:purine-binding chemotaxis protein CheW